MNPTDPNKLEAALGISREELAELYKSNPQEAEMLVKETGVRLEKEMQQLAERRQTVEKQVSEIAEQRQAVEIRVSEIAEQRQAVEIRVSEIAQKLPTLILENYSNREDVRRLAKEARERAEQLRSYLTDAIQEAIGTQWEKVTTGLPEKVQQALTAENWPGCADADKLGAFIEEKPLPESVKKSISEKIPACTIPEYTAAEKILISLSIPINTANLDIFKKIEGHLKKRDWWWLENVPVRKSANEIERTTVDQSLHLDEGWSFTSNYTGEVESWLKRLTRFWIGQVVETTKERVTRGTTQLALDSVRIGNERYTRAPRLLPPISFAMGTGCKVASGEEFGVAPGITALIPRGGFIGDRNKSTKERNHNMLLPLSAEEPESLPLFLAGASQEALSLTASKIATALLIDTMNEPEKLRVATFKELCGLCYPTAEKIKDSHRKAVKEALIQLDKLAVYWPDKGWRKDRIFEVQPFHGDPPNDTRTNLGLNKAFYQGTLTELKEGDELLKMFRGHFIVNLRIMELTRAGLFRQVLRASAMFNDHYNKATNEPRPEAIKTYHPTEWARLCNYLPDPDAVHASDNAQRKAKSDAVARMESDLQELEKEGFLIIKELTKDKILLHPTKAHLEARDKLKALS